MNSMLGNVGVPMIFVQWPGMFGALAPVILVEGLLLRRWLGLGARDAFVGAAKANTFSTLVGVPLAWLGMLLVELALAMPMVIAADKLKWNLDSPILATIGFLMTIAWLGPAERHLHWMVPLAAALLLIPCFFASVWLETKSLIKSLPTLTRESVRRATWKSNVVSYIVLFALAWGCDRLRVSFERPFSATSARAFQRADKFSGRKPCIDQFTMNDCRLLRAGLAADCKANPE